MESNKNSNEKNWNMRDLLLVFLITSLTISMFYTTQPVQAWGYSVHEEITSQAVDLLPEPWKGYFTDVLDDLKYASIHPDVRKNDIPEESAKHYDDQDEPHQDRNVAFPSSDWELGVISWAVENSTRDLREAIQNNDYLQIIKFMGDIAHYVADAAQPLHATKNYDGQLTNNRGIHSRFESNLVQRYFVDVFSLDHFSNLTIIEDAYNMTEQQIASGLELMPQILAADDLALNSTDTYDDTYYEILYEELEILLKDRIKLAIQNVANLWYTVFSSLNWTDFPEQVQSNPSNQDKSPTSSDDPATFPSILILIVTIPIVIKIRSKNTHSL